MNQSQPATRQELYERIRESSKNEVIRSEMERLGFWNPNAPEPKVADDWLKEYDRLTKELRELRGKQERMNNRDTLLADIRKKRMAESRERQKETKQRRERERIEKAERWKKLKEEDILYLGEDVSTQLNKKEPRPDVLAKRQLPNFVDAKALAASMEVPIGELKFLAYNRKVSKISHYKRFFMKKKSGGQRLISAPMPRLKRLQYWILHSILYKIPVHECVHGFVPDRSIKTNAAPHVGQDVVVNIDLKDFFPTVTQSRVQGLFNALGYSNQISTIFSLLCTEPEVQQAKLDGESWFIHQGERQLPQGAPTSPAITNLICYRLDCRIKGATDKLGFNYTRYADDITLSASGEAVSDICRLIWQVRKIIEEEGFNFHPDKFRVMRKGRRQEVTGLVVNETLSINRNTLRRFRALLHQIEKSGIEGKSWQGNSVNLLNSIQGYADFVAMVRPEKGQLLQARVKAIRMVQKHKRRAKPEAKPKIPAPLVPINKANQPSPAGSDQPPKSTSEPKPFWKKLLFWLD
ncbi:reverse transcriptase family protein [Pelagicoccus enzymogenes]|uniref:reverse transcriptase family protein n=1 Tax=Pelagicoccus enzymogenes TaxID=2773457 RepID=UPI0028117809|nr:reverse transcriptase domain-containing protein [Pelagicoccus enzymogenes]